MQRIPPFLNSKKSLMLSIQVSKRTINIYQHLHPQNGPQWQVWVPHRPPPRCLNSSRFAFMTLAMQVAHHQICRSVRRWPFRLFHLRSSHQVTEPVISTQSSPQSGNFSGPNSQMILSVRHRDNPILAIDLKGRTTRTTPGDRYRPSIMFVLFMMIHIA